MPKKKWNAEIVISAIQELHQKGEKLNSNHAQTKCVPLYQAACVHLGSRKKAIEAAGISYDTVRAKRADRGRIWSRDIVREAIQVLHEQGESLNSNHTQTNRVRLYGAACKYFGSWSKAIAAAGLKYEELRKKELRVWSKETIILAILDRVASGLPINGSRVSEDDRGLYNAARRHFGPQGWAKARMLAGLLPVDPNPKQIWKPFSVREEVIRLHVNGVPLHTYALQQSEFAYILAAGRKVFGSWGNAISSAGLKYEDIRKGRQNFWTNEEIIQGIQNLEARGIRLSSKAIQKSHGDLFGAAVSRFGCWSQAVEAADISYRKHCRVWSTKAWLRQMKPAERQAILDNSRQHARTRRSTKP